MKKKLNTTNHLLRTMPKGQYKHKIRTPYNTLKIQSPNFKVTVRFSHKNSDEKVWKFLSTMIKKEFVGFQEVSEAIMQMSPDELEMLEC